MRGTHRAVGRLPAGSPAYPRSEDNRAADSKCFRVSCDLVGRACVLSEHARRRTGRPRRRSDCLHRRSEGRLGADRVARGPGQGSGKGHRMQLGRAVPDGACWLERVRWPALLPRLLLANDGFRRVIQEARCCRECGTRIQSALQHCFHVRVQNAADSRA